MKRIALAFCSVTEHGRRFETGVPVAFDYVRNTEKSPDFGPRFGQDIEPAGRYVIHNPNPGDLPRGWERGTATFKNPLVLALSTDPDAIYGPCGWKARLHSAFGSKGRQLSCKLRRAGYDGIVTCGADKDTREIVDLSTVKCGRR